ncbi:type II CRISPR-associated endonuclease Cas1 [Ferruginivarius sediminum]|nr:type II CRISPR-associated endonuclease Cas1 [Ferruginivarius sediminum]
MSVIEIATPGTSLAVRKGMLSVNATLIPVEDIDLVIAETAAVSVSGAVLALLAENGVEFVTCDTRHRPVASLFPVAAGATLAPRILRRQAALTPRRRRALWRRIVQAKLRMQAAALPQQSHAARRLIRLSGEIAPGDPGNIEAQAARLYWPALLGSDFRRHASDDANAMLDFGYAVVRAVISRQLHAAGLHRSLGLHHENEENDGNLSDDLIEPFRPVVDTRVRALLTEGAEMDKQTRARLAELPDWPVKSGREWVRCRTAAARLARSLRDAIDGGGTALVLPDSIGSEDDAGRMAEDVGSRIL